MICDLLAVTIIALAEYKYCEPKAVVSVNYTSAPAVYWKCDCTKARKNIRFVIQETIEQSIDSMIKARGNK